MVVITVYYANLTRSVKLKPQGGIRSPHFVKERKEVYKKPLDCA